VVHHPHSPARATVAVCVASLLAAGIAAVGWAPAASGATTCTSAGSAVVVSVVSRRVPVQRVAASSRRVSSSAHLVALSTRVVRTRTYRSSATVALTVGAVGTARATALATATVKASTKVRCGGVLRVVAAAGSGSGGTTRLVRKSATGVARATAQATSGSLSVATLVAKERAHATSLVAATGLAGTSARSRARSLGRSVALLVARARAAAAATSAARLALRHKLAALGVQAFATFPANGTFDYQIGGAYTPSPAARIVDRDHNDAPVAGRYNICYVNAFQSQPGESSAWGSLLLRSGGSLVGDPNWPGEYVVDTRQAAAVASFVGQWVRQCAAKGFQAVELDNLDSYSRSDGLLTTADNLDVFGRLAAIGRAYGIAVAQKNAVELSAQAKARGASFAIAEDCQLYSECSGYSSVYGSSWIDIEYQSAAFSAACLAHGATTSVILRDVEVVPAGSTGYVYRTC
jgi:Glycoside-hydrolase family GH114